MMATDRTIFKFLAILIAAVSLTWIAASKYTDYQIRQGERSSREDHSFGVEVAEKGEKTVGGKEGVSDQKRNLSTKSEIKQTQRILTPEQQNSEKFRILSDDVTATGNFESLNTFFDSLSQRDRERYMPEIADIFSKSGPTHDIKEKLALLSKVNTDSTSLESMRKNIFQQEAKERYDVMKKEGVLESLSNSDFTWICIKITSSRIKSGFVAAADGVTESAKRMAAVGVARTALSEGVMEASSEIGKLPSGIVRDEAVVELVKWLSQTGSAEEAEPWLKTIVDEKAKSRLVQPSRK